jgi:hypothetical protein
MSIECFPDVLIQPIKNKGGSAGKLDSIPEFRKIEVPVKIYSVTIF